MEGEDNHQTSQMVNDMRINRISRLNLLSAAAAIAILAACNTDGVTGSIPETGSSQQLSFSFDQALPSSAPSGRYQVHGDIVDIGSYDENLVLAGPADAPTGLYGWRELAGSKGTAIIRYRADVSEDGSRMVGHSEVAAGTGEYETFIGTSGDFVMHLTDKRTPANSTARIQK